MHLGVLHEGQRLRARIALGVMRMVGRMEPDPVARAALYRPRLFGAPFLRLTAETMRGPSRWSPGERELFAALVSRRNSCPFCAEIHGAMTRHRLDASFDPARIDGWRELTLSPRLRAGLELVEKAVASPDELAADDIRRARAAGLDDADVRDVLRVVFVFSLINRVANAFGFAWEKERYAERGATLLDRMGYRVPGFLLR